jgi:DNA polymerase I-like protein with 3'-5' exonuclease and polymerase domains
MWQTVPDNVTVEMRFRGKIFVFGIQYGGTAESVLAHGGRGLSRSTANLEQLKTMEKLWWEKHPALYEMREKAKADVKATRLYVCPIMGCKRQFFGPIADAIRERWDHDPQHGIAHIVNNAHVPFELWCQANLKTDKNTFGSWGPVLQIHDALISEMPEDRVPEARAELKRMWEQPFTMHGKQWIIPADMKTARRFNELR